MSASGFAAFEQLSRINFPFYPLSEAKHFFLIFTDYFFRALHYFAACSVRTKRTGCRPS
ncbi:hypothetical protein PQR02_06895 [Paraburkholderia sediminicola]|uniref:hypothetical protein n=1 Tax=Paraburkholderia sediminicola TaxID=458836 RepID=UPI0038B8B996